MNRSKKGFTLVELIVVLAILAIIAAIAIPTAFGSIERARESADRSTIDNVNSAIRTYAGIIMTDTDWKNKEDLDKTVGAALKDAGMLDAAGAFPEFQSKKIRAEWKGPASTDVDAPGHFAAVESGGGQIALGQDIFAGATSGGTGTETA